VTSGGERKAGLAACSSAGAGFVLHEAADNITSKAIVNVKPGL